MTAMPSVRMCPRGSRRTSKEAVLLGVDDRADLSEQLAALGGGQKALEDRLLAPARIALEDLERIAQAPGVGHVVSGEMEDAV